MRRNIFLKEYNRILVAVSDVPLRGYVHQESLSVRLSNSGELDGLSVAFVQRDKLPLVIDALLAYSKANTTDEFIGLLEEAGFHNQEKEPFRTEWELERTLERAKALKERLECGLNSETQALGESSDTK